MSKVTDVTIKPACISSRGKDGAYQAAVDYIKRTYDNFPKNEKFEYVLELHVKKVK
jgi:hypothetical protein